MFIPVKEKVNAEDLELTEKLVDIRRVAKVVKGGRRFHFTALVVVGDGQGHVGMGLGKANEVPAAIRKGGMLARKSLITVPLAGSTIPHIITAKFGAARILLRPASPGTGLIAGSAVRAVVGAAGVRDILTKSLGNTTPINLIRATLLALMLLKDPEQERLRRGLKVTGPPQAITAREREFTASGSGK